MVGPAAAVAAAVVLVAPEHVEVVPYRVHHPVPRAVREVGAIGPAGVFCIHVQLPAREKIYDIKKYITRLKNMFLQLALVVE